MKYEYLLPEHKKDVEGIHTFIYGVKDGIELQEEWELDLKVIYFLCKSKFVTAKGVASDIFVRDPSLDYHRTTVMVRTQLKALSKIGITKSVIGPKEEAHHVWGTPCSQYSLV